MVYDSRYDPGQEVNNEQTRDLEFINKSISLNQGLHIGRETPDSAENPIGDISVLGRYV